MRRSLKHKMHAASASFPSAKRWLAVIFLLCILIRILTAFGTDSALDDCLRRLIQSDGTAAKILSFELGPSTGGAVSDIANLLFKSSLSDSGAEDDSISSDTEDDPPVPDAGTETDTDAVTDDTGKTSEDTETSSDIGDTSVISGIFGDGTESLSAGGITIKNKTGYEIDIEALLNDEPDITISGDEPSVLIIHTHGSEAYDPDGEDIYVESDPSRTEDKNYNVVRVGDELTEALEAYGISVFHDRELYDYPSYSGSYTRALASIESILEENPSIKLVIDLHRDAIVGDDGTVYKTVAQVDNTTCSQVLMIVGTNYSGLDHPKWQENLKFALRLQYAMNELYPSLAKPISISQYRYNQQATTGSLILEVGCNGNTLQEALDAVVYFADAAAAVILSLTE